MPRNDLMTALGVALAALVLLGGRILANPMDRKASKTNPLEKGLLVTRLFLAEQFALFVAAFVLIFAMFILTKDAEYDWLGIVMLSIALIYLCSIFIGGVAHQMLHNFSYRMKVVKHILDTRGLEGRVRDSLLNCVRALETENLFLAVWHGKIALETWARDQKALSSDRTIESCLLSPPVNAPRNFQHVWDQIQLQGHDVLRMLWSLEPSTKIPDPEKEIRAHAMQFLRVLWKELVDPEVLPLDLR